MTFCIRTRGNLFRGEKNKGLRRRKSSIDRKKMEVTERAVIPWTTGETEMYWEEREQKGLCKICIAILCSEYAKLQIKIYPVRQIKLSEAPDILSTTND